MRINTTDQFQVEPIEYVSDQSFDDLVAALEKATGDVTDGKYASEVASTKDKDDFEERARSFEADSGFMRFLSLNHSGFLTLMGAPAKVRQYTIGNPLIAATMLQHDVGGGFERPGSSRRLRRQGRAHAPWLRSTVVAHGSPRQPEAQRGRPTAGRQACGARGARDRRMSASPASGSPELELHGAKTGNCLRAAIGLSEAGLPYKTRHVDLGQGEQRSKPHLALTPAGKVPVLVARGSADAPAFVLTQSSAILFYADAEAPGRILPPHGDRERIGALERFFYFTSDVIALNGAAFSLRGPEFSGAAAALTERYLSAIIAAERFLIDNEFMGGASFSIADIAAFTIISAVSRRLSWDQLPRLAAWHDRIGRRLAVQTGMTAFDNKRETTN